MQNLFLLVYKIIISCSSDAHSCANDPSIYFTDQHNIKCIDLKSYNNTYESVKVKTAKTGLTDAGAIDIDHRERMIYWSDHAQWTINRMSLLNGDMEVKRDATLFCLVHN